MRGERMSKRCFTLYIILIGSLLLGGCQLNKEKQQCVIPHTTDADDDKIVVKDEGILNETKEQQEATCKTQLWQSGSIKVGWEGNIQ